VDCSECVAFISRKLEGTLTRPETRELNAHLSRCGRCRAELVLQQKMLHALKQELPGRLPADFSRRVTGQVARLEGKGRRRWFRLADLLPAVPAAAGAVLLVFFWRDMAGFIAPAMEGLADITGAPLSSLGNWLAEALKATASGSQASLPGSGLVARVFASVYVSAGVAGIAVIWAFSRAYRFVR